MAVGDGAIMRKLLEELVEVLRNFASPTGARASVLLMTGGLVVLGFLFTAFVFRSTIVGDLAPVANARAPLPRARLPGETRPVRAVADAAKATFADARRKGRQAKPTVDSVFETLLEHGVDARIVWSDATTKRVRVYRCPSCEFRAADAGCERERGLLAGGFESYTGQLVKVEEVGCASRGHAYCEFDVRHAAAIRVKR